MPGNAPRHVVLQGTIQRLCFNGQLADLPSYDWQTFDINSARKACKVRLPDGTEIAVSKWTGPKRTRTYPLASVYDTYSHNGKIVAIIPILKDEGRGERENDTNLDRVNYITLSWMNLMGVYIVLAWYQDASKEDDYRITKQRMDNHYVNKKLEEIARYKMDAHHWNREHFVENFIPVYEKAIASYQAIAQRHEVRMHDPASQLRFLEQVRSESNPSKLDLRRYAEHTLPRSERAALREAATQHQLERLQTGSVKGIFKIRDYLGGEYYLTADEILFFESTERIIIQESKNSTTRPLPSMSNIKDGLFKLLLFSQLEELRLGERSLKPTTRLRITGAFRGALELPASDERLEAFARSIHASTSSLRSIHASTSSLKWLSEELRRLGINGVLEGQDG